MRLSYRFQQADPVRGYHFLLSSLVKEGALPDDSIVLNIRKIKRALKECGYIIDKFTTSEITQINPETWRRKVVDYKVHIFPTTTFQDEQYRINTHYKAIQNHRFTKEGEVIIKPMKDQYPDRKDFGKYLDDRGKYDKSI